MYMYCCVFNTSICTCIVVCLILVYVHEQRFFLFREKRVVWVSCLPLFSIYRKEFSCIVVCLILVYVHVLL